MENNDRRPPRSHHFKNIQLPPVLWDVKEWRWQVEASSSSRMHLDHFIRESTEPVISLSAADGEQRQGVVLSCWSNWCISEDLKKLDGWNITRKPQLHHEDFRKSMAAQSTFTSNLPGSDKTIVLEDQKDCYWAFHKAEIMLCVKKMLTIWRSYKNL